MEQKERQINEMNKHYEREKKPKPYKWSDGLRLKNQKNKMKMLTLKEIKKRVRQDIIDNKKQADWEYAVERAVYYARGKYYAI